MAAVVVAAATDAAIKHVVAAATDAAIKHDDDATEFIHDDGDDATDASGGTYTTTANGPGAHES